MVPVKRFLVLMSAALLLVACATVGPARDASQPSSDRVQHDVPLFEAYTGADGGWVAVYTHDREHSVYGVGDGIYVAGLVRVQGGYVGRIFYPSGYEPGDDITHDAAILKLCDHYFPELGGHEWIGGDTGGFALQ